MPKFKIYLVEDEPKHAEETIGKLEEAAHERGGEFEYEFEWLEGTIEREEGKYVFYEEKILKQIRNCIKGDKKNNILVGLLLDTLLTQDDIEGTLNSYYAEASIARDIYNEFYKKVPVYIVTATSVFGAQSDIIMGKDLSEQFINQRRLAMNPLKTIREDTDRLFRFYEGFYEHKQKKGEE